MISAFSEEQEELRRTTRDFLADTSAESDVRRLMETATGYDPGTWRLMANQIGLQGLAIPDEYGGAGCGFVELGVVCEQMGAALLCAPFFSTVVLAANTVLLSGDAGACAEYLPGIAAGETVATLALTDLDGHWDPTTTMAAASPNAHGWTLDGTKLFVLDGHVADVIFVAARTGAGTTLFAVDGDAPGLRRTPLATLDQTRKQARLDFVTTPARLVGEEGDGARVLAKVLDLAAVALATEQVGGAQRTLDMAVDYAQTRMQFGRPIGSFQSIKHKCADVLVEVESARSAAYHAVWAAAEDDPDLPVAASLAKAYCSDAYVHAAAENIQIHGGIGFTWEHPAHLYFKRAKSSQLTFGDPAYHREQLAQRLPA